MKAVIMVLAPGMVMVISGETWLGGPSMYILLLICLYMNCPSTSDNEGSDNGPSTSDNCPSMIIYEFFFLVHPFVKIYQEFIFMYFTFCNCCILSCDCCYNFDFCGC